ncbi:MAG: hypothetical protein H8E31_11690 [Planctomycetes bacterium]|nr:hypothetical protein [Planctomycetota bacterium]
MLVTAAVLWSALQDPLGRAPGGRLEVQELVSPAAGDGLWPVFATSGDRRPWLLWTERGDSGARLMTSGWSVSGWLRPEEVARGDDWFVNWADFPQMAVSAEGLRLCSWLRKTGASSYAYEVRLASGSADGVWQPRGVLHRDRKPAEHGFVSLVPLPSGGFAAAWLDGRQEGEMALYGGLLSESGQLRDEYLLDPLTCECCQTDAVLLDDGTAVVAYRDRSAEEIRDIAVVRGRPEDAGSWREPVLVHRDRWRIPGCPVNGPALASDGERLAVVWYTLGAEGVPRVSCAFSEDGGASFGEPLQVDLGKPVGRVDALFQPSGALLVSWLEYQDGEACWMARELSLHGAGPAVRLALASGERNAGFLRLGALGEAAAAGEGGAFATWTDPADRRLRLVRIRSGPANAD